MDYVLQSLSILLAVVGTSLLVREVGKAHKVEEIGHEMNVARELLALHATDIREFWIRSAMRSSSHSRATAERMAADLGTPAIEAGVAQSYGQLYEQDLPRAVDRWHDLTVPAVLMKRRRDLWAGFWLLIAGLGLQFVVATGTFFWSW